MRASEEMLDVFTKLNLVVGFDGEDENKDDESETDEESDEENDEENEDESEEDKETDDNKLKKALREERRQRRKFEREAIKLKREADRAKNKGESEAQQAIADAAEQRAKSDRLAGKLRNSAEDNLITKLATKMKFRDIDDALKLVDRSKIEVDQDEENPEDVEIDETSINDALKVLAKSKPHLLIAAGDQGPSGGNLGRSGKDKDQLDEEKLRQMYPTLRR
jgi:uncharacterized membrane protein YqiK